MALTGRVAVAAALTRCPRERRTWRGSRWCVWDPKLGALSSRSKWDVLDVRFLRVSSVVFTLQLLRRKTPSSRSSGSCRNLGGEGNFLCPRALTATQELHPIGNHIHCAALHTILSFPGAVLEAPFHQDGVSFFLVVGYRFPQLPPGANVEEVRHFTLLGSDPVHRN